jgi:hypothetical protein
MAKAVLLLMRNYPELLISATKSGQLEIGYSYLCSSWQLY